MVPMSIMMLNVVFSGIGAGFLNMLMYIIVAVFLAGLMVGRTPEYLGKKIEAKEVKLAMIAILIHPLLILCGRRTVRGDRHGGQDVGQPRPARFQRDPLRVHLGLRPTTVRVSRDWRDNNPAWNIATGIVLLLGRFPALISAAGDRRVPGRQEARSRRPPARSAPTT